MVTIKKQLSFLLIAGLLITAFQPTSAYANLESSSQTQITVEDKANFRESASEFAQFILISAANIGSEYGLSLSIVAVGPGMWAACFLLARYFSCHPFGSPIWFLKISAINVVLSIISLDVGGKMTHVSNSYLAKIVPEDNRYERARKYYFEKIGATFRSLSQAIVERYDVSIHIVCGIAALVLKYGGYFQVNDELAEILQLLP